MFNAKNLAKWKQQLQAWQGDILSLLGEILLAIISIVAMWKDSNFHTGFRLFMSISIGIIFILLFIHRCTRFNLKRNFQKEQKINQISKAVFSALYNSNSSKLQEIFRYTYGSVSKWNPIDYTENVLVYDVHEQIRSILISLEKLIIDIDPERFNDRNVSVELVYCYPRDDKSIEKYNWQIEKIPLDEECYKKHKESGQRNPWKLISSGDTSGDQISILSHLANPKSFYSLIDSCGTVFKNKKFDCESAYHRALVQKHEAKTESTKMVNDIIKQLNTEDQECYFVEDIRDYERFKDGKLNGSAIGTIINIRNDNPEVVFIKAILTINTYGESIFLPCRESKKKTTADVDKFGMTCDDYEDIFINTILSTYSRLLETELAQMYIRHTIREGIRCRKTGQWLKAKKGSNEEIPEKGYKCPCSNTGCKTDPPCTGCNQSQKCKVKTDM